MLYFFRIVAVLYIYQSKAKNDQKKGITGIYFFAAGTATASTACGLAPAMLQNAPKRCANWPPATLHAEQREKRVLKPRKKCVKKAGYCPQATHSTPGSRQTVQNIGAKKPARSWLVGEFGF